MQNGLANPNNAGAAAYPYMNLMGVVCLGLMWLRMAKASAAALAERHRQCRLPQATSSSPPASSPTASCRRATPHRRKIEAGADSIMALPAEAF